MFDIQSLSVHMNNGNNIIIDANLIRKEYNKKTSSWYFSVVDIISIITDSSDPRNYWKVLKSRLNKTNPQLVTNCIQLKLPSGDGKSYATDTADAETLCAIIATLSPAREAQFCRWFEEFEYRSAKDIHSLGTADAELQVDMHDTPSEIIVKCFLAGIAPSDVTITANYDHLSISGARPLIADATHIYVQQELYWGTFAREIDIADAIEVSQITASELHGLLTIRIPKIDIARTRIIKISSSK